MIWEYIHGLDLVEGGFVVCNDALKELFGEEKCGLFEFVSLVLLALV